jgi:hypothetical protein
LRPVAGGGHRRRARAGRRSTRAALALWGLGGLASLAGAEADEQERDPALREHRVHRRLGAPAPEQEVQVEGRTVYRWTVGGKGAHPPQARTAN